MASGASSGASVGTAAAHRALNLLTLLLHIHKTLLLLGAVLADERVHWARKSAFLGALGTLVAAVVFPEAAADLIALLVPLLGLIGVPIEVGAEAGLDWMVVAVAAFNLLRIFPPEIVGEHYDRLFRGR